MNARPRCILHLADPHWPGGGPCALRMLAAAASRLTHDRHVVIVLGSRAALELARRCGVQAVGHVPIPGGCAPLARSALARAVSSLAREHGPFAIVHGWSSRAALLCSASRGSRAVATCTVAPVEGLHAELLGATVASKPMPLLVPTASVRHEMIALGIDRTLVPILPAGIETTRPREDARADIRRRWGVGESTLAIGLVGDPVEWTDARGAIFMLTLLRVAGHDAHLVVHPRANRADRMVRWAAPLGVDRHVSVDPGIALPWEVAAGLDVATLLGDETTAIEPRPLGSPLSMILGGGRPARPIPGVLPVLWTAAAGVPTLAAASLAACGVIEEGVTGLLVEPRRIDAAVRRLVALIEDPQLRGRLGSAASRRTSEANSLSAMAVRLRQVYDSLVADGRVPTPLQGVETDDEVEAIRWRPAPERRAQTSASAGRDHDRHA